MPPTLHVVAGIISNQHGDILLTSRPQGKAYAGYWEFAGGKVETGESELAALQREFNEELGIHIHRATPYLAKIHAYEHAIVHLRFFRVAAEDWTGKPHAREGQQLAWQNPAYPTVSPMLPANSHLLSALTMPQQLSGSLKTGLYSQDDCYRIVPYPAATAQQNVMLSLEQLQQLGKLPKQHHVWAIIHSVTDFQAAPDVSGVIWQIQNTSQAQTVLQLLQQGVALPIVVYAPSSLCTLFATAWRSMGAQAVIEHHDTAIV